MILLRLVLDTNVIVSAALKPNGLSRTVLTLALTRPARLCASAEILSEYREVLARPEFKIRKGLRQQFLKLVTNRARVILPKRRLEVSADPDDNKFLECAEAASADYLVTGNLRHFPKYWKQTKVITPGEFMNVVAPHLL